MQNRISPIVVVNFKSSRRGSGESGLTVAKKLDEVQRNLPDAQIIVAVPPQDIYRISHETGLTVFAQHVDPISFGDYSGSICPEAIQEAGASGTLLNHPEKKLRDDICQKTTSLCQRAGLAVILCASTLQEVAQFEQYHPDYIGLECTSLIGKPYSLFDVYPTIVDEALAQSRSRILFGAGIKNAQDVQRIINKGGAGVIVSSAILNAADPAAALYTLLNNGLITV